MSLLPPAGTTLPWATDRGVRRVVLPWRGPKSPTRRAYERQRWFRRGQCWRVGSEGRISVLKRRHGLTRCRYHGLDGMQRWVGLGVIANNLVSTATFSKTRAADREMGDLTRSVIEPAAESRENGSSRGHFFTEK